MAESRAVSFGEATCYLDMGDVFPFTGTSSYSIELWFYDDQDAGATVNHSLVDRSTLVGPQNGYDVYFNASFTLFSRLCGDAGEEGYAGIDSGPPLGQWTHIVATYDGTMTTLYLNGQARASLASPDPQGAGAGLLRFGQSARTPDPALGGALDEIAVYDSALSSTSVHNHFAAATSP
jgi:Concanavalin A-like lectin/glucanases superfamily